MRNKQGLVFLDGEWLKTDHKINRLFGAGFYYGAGCFETMRADHGKIFKYKEHIQRLHDGLKYLGKEGDSIPNGKDVRKIISDLIDKNDLGNKSCKIRVQCSLVESGYSIDIEQPVIIHIFAEQINIPGPDNVKLGRVENRVVPSECRPAHLKLTNMIHYRKAYQEAIGKGYDDALMMNTNQFIAETSKANIFWMRGDRIFTPSIDCDILPGIMRNSMIDIIQQNSTKLELVEGRYTESELLNADAVWITNSVIEIARVSHIDGKKIGLNESFINNLKMQYMDYKTEQLG